jgi:uncharacterized membrane protein YeaQ/YmgE (transglycosylase-associated protein family)
VIGGIVGWLASVMMRTDSPQGILTKIIVGVSGSYVGGTFVAPFLRSGPWFSYLSAFVGAVVLIAALNIVTRSQRS